MPLPETLYHTLRSYVEGQKSEGIRTIPWNGPLPGERSFEPEATPARPEIPAAPPLDKNPPQTALPHSPAPQPIAEVSRSTIQWCTAHRHPDCRDSDGPEQPTIVVISEREEFQNEAGDLLENMLKAIGFQLNPPVQNLENNLPEKSNRLLVLGDPALQAVSTVGMKLQLVRGLWQEHAQGRMLATYEPSAVTDSPSGKKTVWGDLQLLVEDLGLSIPEWTVKKLKKKRS